MRVICLLFLLVASARSAMSPEIAAFNRRLQKFDDAYLNFRKIYCSIPTPIPVGVEKVPCILGDTFPYGEWKKARETAKAFFGLVEKP